MEINNDNKEQKDSVITEMLKKMNGTNVDYDNEYKSIFSQSYFKSSNILLSLILVTCSILIMASIFEVSMPIEITIINAAIFSAFCTAPIILFITFKFKHLLSEDTSFVKERENLSVEEFEGFESYFKRLEKHLNKRLIKYQVILWGTTMLSVGYGLILSNIIANTDKMWVLFLIWLLLFSSGVYGISMAIKVVKQFKLYFKYKKIRKEILNSYSE